MTKALILGVAIVCIGLVLSMVMLVVLTNMICSVRVNNVSVCRYDPVAYSISFAYNVFAMIMILIIIATMICVIIDLLETEEKRKMFLVTRRV